jgi:hypothetical protein
VLIDELIIVLAAQGYGGFYGVNYWYFHEQILHQKGEEPL